MDVEYEQGTYVPTPQHRHNGYYAGDFSDRPFPTVPEYELIMIRVPARVGPPW